jgi:hypothetical protein
LRADGQRCLIPRIVRSRTSLIGANISAFYVRPDSIRHVEAEFDGGSAVENGLELVWLEDWHLGGIPAVENVARIAAHLGIHVREAEPVADQAAFPGEYAPIVDAGMRWRAASDTSWFRRCLSRNGPQSICITRSGGIMTRWLL